ncbi:MAG: SDR family oxidoreductase [Rhodospirillaceae bacterium]
MEIRLDGRAALITGGSEGLGKGMALKFAESGADVAILARRKEALDAAKVEIQSVSKGQVVAISCDLACPENADQAFTEAEQALGKIDILINNAGTSRSGPFMDITDEDWQSDFDLKFFSAVKLIRRAIPGMQRRKWGRIINTLNIGAKAPPAKGAPTAVTRAAGMALTKVLAQEFAPDNILVNALLVGLIKSNQWVRRYERLQPNEDYETFVQGMVDSRNIPLGRIGETDEFANIACFLASDAAGYITGTAINVDGGKAPIV